MRAFKYYCKISVGLVLLTMVLSAQPVAASLGGVSVADEDYEVWDVESASHVIALRQSADTCVVDDDLSVAGESVLTASQLTEFVRRNNPDFDSAIADAFLEMGRRYGIRGDVALCQSIVETGWFMFDGGTAVTPDQHNYCGLGVLKRGMKGHSFETVEQGVTAQIQHLYAYICSDALPKGESIIDPRFRLVRRGVARTWQELSGRWAANDRYGRQILTLYRRALAEAQRSEREKE